MPRYDDDDDFDRPRRSRDDDDWYDQRRDYDDGPANSSDPRHRVIAPGRALFITGIIGIFLSLVGAIGFPLLFANAPNPPPPQEQTMMMVIFVVCFGLSAVYFGVIAWGGWRMAQCRNFGLAMTACVMAVASIACLGLLSIIILPFGIWALVVLNDRSVKRAFQRDANQHDYDQHSSEYDA